MNDLLNQLDDDVRRYVLGKMVDPELQLFEEDMVLNPQLAERVALFQDMSEGLKEVSTLMIGERDKNNFLSRLLDWLMFPIPAYASALFGIALGVTFVSTHDSDNYEQKLALLNFSSTVTRSNVENFQVDLPSQPEASVLLVKLAEVEYEFHKLILVDTTNKRPIWSSEPKVAGTLREVLFSIPPLSKTGKAGVEVVGITEKGTEVPVRFCHYNEVCNQ